MSNRKIVFNNVTKKYSNSTIALKNVSLSINEGEFVFVIGSSGSGKSTFLKLILKENIRKALSLIHLMKMIRNSILTIQTKLISQILNLSKF